MASRADNDSSAEDAYLIGRIAREDREALRMLYGRYAGPLLAFGLRFVGDHGAAEELLQDTFVKIWKHAGTFEPAKASAFTWAVTIMRRTCIDFLRRRNRSLVSASVALEDVGTEPTEPEQARAQAERSDDTRRLETALAQLPAQQRRALELALFSDLSHADIAEQLGEPVGTVKSWIRRGLLQLQFLLKLSHA